MRPAGPPGSFWGHKRAPMGPPRRLRMNRSIRNLVGVGAAALALGGFFALVVAPQVAGAGIRNTTRAGASVQHGAVQHGGAVIRDGDQGACSTRDSRSDPDRLLHHSTPGIGCS